MAQNITLLGASYTAVPAVTLPKTGGGTARFDDASITTATASDVASGKVFLASDGTITTGTSSGSTTISPLSVTANGTYTAPSGTAYSPVTVNVSGGGGASNIVTGTFTGTTTGAAMDVTLNYSGSGYPVAVMVYPSEGTYNNTTTPHPYYNLVQRYAIDSFIATKSDALTAPTYTDTTSTNYAEVYRISKSNATSNTSISGGTAVGASRVKVFTEDGATSSNNHVVKINSSTKMSVFIASNSYGFAVNIPYTYHVIYSS